jgi:hypothetical protein
VEYSENDGEGLSIKLGLHFLALGWLYPFNSRQCDEKPHIKGEISLVGFTAPQLRDPVEV